MAVTCSFIPDIRLVFYTLRVVAGSFGPSSHSLDPILTLLPNCPGRLPAHPGGRVAGRAGLLLKSALKLTAAYACPQRLLQHLWMVQTHRQKGCVEGASAGQLQTRGANHRKERNGQDGAREAAECKRALSYPNSGEAVAQLYEWNEAPECTRGTFQLLLRGLTR